MRTLTIVMYHYVRDLEHSAFPRIKGLSTKRFKRQLEYITSHYSPIAAEDLLQALSTPEKQLPSNAILLTFDDGYSDHFTNVFPLLDARGIKACFFPPAQAVLENTVLDVNKIHFTLAVVPDARVLLEQVFDWLDEFRSEYKLESRDEYLAVKEEHRYDSHDVVLLKRLLQRELPEAIRKQIVQRLFSKFVTTDEATFARELYMSPDQIDCLRQNGMHIGSHGYAHVWLNRVPPESQVSEIDHSLDFLQTLGVRKDYWSICYPYGGFNESLLNLLRKRNCQLGFTVEPRVADLDVDDRLTLPRIDTNDLPS